MTSLLQRGRGRGPRRLTLGQRVAGRGQGSLRLLRGVLEGLPVSRRGLAVLHAAAQRRGRLPERVGREPRVGQLLSRTLTALGVLEGRSSSLERLLHRHDRGIAPLPFVVGLHQPRPERGRFLARCGHGLGRGSNLGQRRLQLLRGPSGLLPAPEDFHDGLGCPAERPLTLSGLAGFGLRLPERRRRDVAVLPLQRQPPFLRPDRGLIGDAVGPFGHPAEQRQPEEVGQEVSPLLRVADEELGELPLGQQDRTDEAVVGQPDGPGDHRLGLSHPVGPVARLDPFALDPALQEDLRGSLARRSRSRQPIPVMAHFEFQRHRHARLALADQLSHVVANPFDLAVQRVRHRVEQG